MHVYALDVGTGSAVLIRTPSGQQILFDGGPDETRFAQAIGRALPPTARSLRLWILTGGRRAQIGAAQAVMARFHIEQVLVADPDAWTPSPRMIVVAARQAGIPVTADTVPPAVDGVILRPASDGKSWLVGAQGATLAVIPPDSGWPGYPAGVRAAIFMDGGPSAWSTPPAGDLAVIQVTSQSRDGLPARGLLRGPGWHLGAPDRPAGHGGVGGLGFAICATVNHWHSRGRWFRAAILKLRR